MKRRFLLAVTLFLVLVTIASVVGAHDQGGLYDMESAAYKEIVERVAQSDYAPMSMTPCVQGFAGTFPCDKVDLLSYVPSQDMGALFVNDIWGWTDPTTGNDYALVGTSGGMVIVDISDPKRPVIMGTLPTHTTLGGEFWRDIKVYANHAFVVSEHDNHGMQVLDLTQLRNLDVSGGPVVFTETAHYDGIGHSHNLNINEESGFAYVVGSSTCTGGLHMINISNPANPTFAGCFDDHGYTHDTQCVIYRGPDASYQGRELCFNSNTNVDFTLPFPDFFFGALTIVDVTDKSNPVALAYVEYPDDGYSHQGWLTSDQRHFLHGDELDELFFGHTTRTRIWDVSDVDNPLISGMFDNTTMSTDHNIYTQGRYAYASNYTSGLRVYDTKDLANNTLTEAAYFDVYPENDNPGFEGGTWSNYAYFAQKGVVAVSSMDRGLFILQPRVDRSGN